jgi:hypothetical protein
MSKRSTPDCAWARRARRLYASLYRVLVVALLLRVTAASLFLPFDSAWAQEPAAKATSLADRLSFFRWLEDYSDVSDEQRAASLFARVKRIPLVSGQLYPYLSMGGNYRFRYEHSSNQRFGIAPPRSQENSNVGLHRFQEDSNVGLHRFLLHGDLHLRESIRAFVQFGGFLETGRPGRPLPTDESEPDIQQAFVDLKFAPDYRPLQIRLGRQEITVGRGLHTAVREGPNQRLSFDAARGTLLLGEAVAIDVFYGQEVLPDKRAFRDSHKRAFRDSPVDSRLWGIYGSKVARLGGSAFLDLYYLGLDRDGSDYNRVMGDEVRHTLGIRMNGARGAWTYDYEGLFQFGTFKDQDILAGALLTANYYTFQTVPWQPRVGLRANFGSGDRDPRDGMLGTFDSLFPNPSYLSEAAIYYPRNLYELHPVMEIMPYKTVKLSMGVPFLWRFSRDDAVYAVPGVSLVSSDDSRGWFTGYLFDLMVQWQPSPHLLLQLSYVHAGAGNAIRDAGGTDLDFLMMSVETRF